MGYDMRVWGELTLPKEKREDALAAILKEHDEDAFWSNPDFQAKRDRGESVTFEEVFGEVMARSSYGEPNLYPHDEDEHTFSFDGEVRAGWGEEQTIHAIAPYVTIGHICWEGEDGEGGRYVFAHGRVEGQYAATIYGMSSELAYETQARIDRDTVDMLAKEPADAQ